MSDENGPQLSRHAMEIATAIATGAAGAIIAVQSWRLGAGWGDYGPQSGYFPFYIGLLIVAGSAVSLLRALVGGRHKGEVFLNVEKAKPVLGFFLPLLGFAIVSVWLGLYVGTALYVAFAMIRQGGYRWYVGVGTGLAVTVFFFLAFEYAFQVPLLKGPVEAALGIH